MTRLPTDLVGIGRYVSSILSGMGEQISWRYTGRRPRFFQEYPHAADARPNQRTCGRGWITSTDTPPPHCWLWGVSGDPVDEGQSDASDPPARGNTGLRGLLQGGGHGLGFPRDVRRSGAEAEASVPFARRCGGSVGRAAHTCPKGQRDVSSCQYCLLGLDTAWNFCRAAPAYDTSQSLSSSLR